MELKVLVVDDDRASLELLEDILTGIGCKVLTTDSGASALDMIEAEGFDLIISDIRMPGVGGLDILKFARRNNPDSLVVLVTGFASIETAMEAIKGGVYDYITKPFTVDEVLVVVRNAAERIVLERKNARLLEKLGEVYAELKTGGRPAYEEAVPASVAQPATYDGRLIPVLEPRYDGPPWKDALHEIDRLAQLRREGSITSEEFDMFKGKILGYY